MFCIVFRMKEEPSQKKGYHQYISQKKRKAFNIEIYFPLLTFFQQPNRGGLVCNPGKQLSDSSIIKRWPLAARLNQAKQ